MTWTGMQEGPSPSICLQAVTITCSLIKDAPVGPSGTAVMGCMGLMTCKHAHMLQSGHAKLKSPAASQLFSLCEQSIAQAGLAVQSSISKLGTLERTTAHTAKR